MAVYSIMQFIFAPMWGRLSDRVGRKPLMLLGILGLSFSFFFMALAEELWVLFAARILGGFLSSANMPTVQAYVADITSEEDRGKGMGIVGAAVGLGFVFGPAIGGIFSQMSLAMPFYVAGFSSLVTFLLVLFVVKESLPQGERGQNVAAEKIPFLQSFKSSLTILYFLQFFVSISLAGLEATFAYFAAERAGLGTVELGYIFMIMGFAGALVQGGLVGRMTKKFGEGIVIQIGIIMSAFGFGLILLVDNFLTAAIFLSLFGIGNGVIRPSVSALITKTATKGYGRATGMLSSFDSLGRIIGPPFGGWLFSIAVGLPYITGIVLSAVAFFLYYVYYMQQKKKVPTTATHALK